MPPWPTARPWIGSSSTCSPSRKIAPTRENGYGDSQLKLFERHLLLIRPDTVVIYDVLESEVASDWTLLLHTMKKPTLDQSGLLRLDTEKNRATGFVTGSQPLHSNLTDQFHSLPLNLVPFVCRTEVDKTPRTARLPVVRMMARTGQLLPSEDAQVDVTCARKDQRASGGVAQADLPCR